MLQTAYRRSDIIESIHDGSFFAGEWTKLGLFLPSAIGFQEVPATLRQDHRLLAIARDANSLDEALVSRMP